MINTKSSLATLLAAALLGGCVTAPEPIFDSDHPANADASVPDSTGLEPLSLQYRSEADMALSTNGEAKKRPGSSTNEKPSNHGGAHENH